MFFARMFYLILWCIPNKNNMFYQFVCDMMWFYVNLKSTVEILSYLETNFSRSFQRKKSVEVYWNLTCYQPCQKLQLR